MLFLLAISLAIKSVALLRLKVCSSIHTVVQQDGADTEMSRLKLFEGDILLVEGEGVRRRRSDIMTSSGQEANMKGMDDTAYTRIWPNRTVYYTFGQSLGEQSSHYCLHKNSAWACKFG